MIRTSGLRWYLVLFVFILGSMDGQAQVQAQTDTAVNPALKPAQSGNAPQLLTNNDPRVVALDIFTALRRGDPAQSIVIRLQGMIRLYRNACDRVTDYQIFDRRQNYFIMKVKCTKSPMYGITVAANGFGTVYGGNGMLTPFDRRDGLIYSFQGDGFLAGTSNPTGRDIIAETISRVSTEDGYSGPVLYVLIIIIIFIFLFTLVFQWLRSWRSAENGKLHRRRRKMRGLTPMGELSSASKNNLIEQSKMVKERLYRHPTGIFLAVGPKGKRRLFKRRLWATFYQRYGWRFFEILRLPSEKV